MSSGTRINKYLSEIGYCSRRAADRLIDENRVCINGEVPALGTKIMPGDVLTVDGKNVGQSEDLPKDVYIAFHKPIGIVCTTDTKTEPNNIIDYIRHPLRIFPIGRLDKASEGLIFLTNDGDIVNKILRAKNNHEKEYIVTVDRPITEEFVNKMSSGVPILGTTTMPCIVEKRGPRVFRMILTQGLNRQIRRMCSAFDYQVVRLERTRIMNVRLDVAEGEWRDLRPAELSELRRLCEDDEKTA